MKDSLNCIYFTHKKQRICYCSVPRGSQVCRKGLVSWFEVSSTASDCSTTTTRIRCHDHFLLCRRPRTSSMHLAESVCVHIGGIARCSGVTGRESEPHDPRLGARRTASTAGNRRHANPLIGRNRELPRPCRRP